jgi:uncharacterized protein involved in exopolysaccharide biosynthesis
MEEEIDLRDIIDFLWRSRLLIIGIFMIALLVAGVISLAMPSTYRASSIIALGNFCDPLYTGQENAKNIMLSDGFLLDVIKELNLNVSVNNFDAFKACINIRSLRNSQLWFSIDHSTNTTITINEGLKCTDDTLEISVESKSRQEAKEIVEGIVRLFANRSEGRYLKEKNLLSEQLAITQKILSTVEEDINQTQEELRDIEDGQGLLPAEKDLLYSKKLDYLRNEELQRLNLLDRYLDLQEQLALLENLEVVQPAREPIPVEPHRTLIVVVAGILGLMVGILAAFLREVLGRPAE